MLKKQQNLIGYLDLFAGPVKYENGRLSTPLLLAQLCAKDLVLCEKVHLIFNDKYYSSQLETNWDEIFSNNPVKFKPKLGDKTVRKDDAIKTFINKETYWTFFEIFLREFKALGHYLRGFDSLKKPVL